MRTLVLSSSSIPPVTTNCESSGITHHFIIGGHEGYITVVMGVVGKPIENLHNHVENRLYADWHDDCVCRRCFDRT